MYHAETFSLLNFKIPLAFLNFKDRETDTSTTPAKQNLLK